jgi:hypothetical protein
MQHTDATYWMIDIEPVKVFAFSIEHPVSPIQLATCQRNRPTIFAHFPN